MKANKFSILIITLIFVISGCSVPIGEYFSIRYQNVMGYFNTYYNARKMFDEALLELYKNPPKGLDTNYFSQYIANQAVRTKFNVVLEKGSRLIQFYPKSKWVDDALMMIGQIYYYEDEPDLAIKKFEELIENFPRSENIPRTHLFYARTLYNLEDYDNAISYIDNTLKDVIEFEEDVAIEMQLLKTQIFYELGEYNKALNVLDELFKIDGDGYLLALAASIEGRINEVTGNYDKAKLAYQKVLKYKPDRNLKFRSELSYGRMLRELGEHEIALKIFLDMKDNETLSSNLAYIDLEIAQTYDHMGDFETAISYYELVDSLYKKTDAAAKSYYYRALMYENVYQDFNEAKFYYDKAKTEHLQSEITNLAQKKADVLAKYLTYQNEIAKYDSLYKYTLKRLSDTTNSIDNDSLVKTKNLIKSDSIDINTQQDSTEENDIIGEESGDVLLDPEVPSLQQTRIDDKNLKQPANLNPDSILNLMTRSQLELATLFFLELGLVDSADVYFSKVTESKFSDIFSPRAYYALMEINKIKGNLVKSDSFYNLLIQKYPTSEYSIYAKKMNGIDLIEEKSSIEELYEKTLNLIDNKKYKEALKQLSNICKYDTSSQYCLKSIYTSGWLYENVLNNLDSAKYYYKLLVNNYPQSIYAQAVLGKVTVADDSSKLSQFIKIKEIIPPPPPTPKITVSEDGSKQKVGIQQRKQSTRRDYREEEEEEEEPTFEEPEVETEEPE